MDKRPVNFSQKGFTGKFLSLMKQIEKNDLCCQDFPIIYSDFTPANSADPKGDIGNIAFDSNFFYVKTSVGWKRTALSSF